MKATMTPCIRLRSQAAEAVKFYATALQLIERNVMLRDDGTVLHAHLGNGSLQLMIWDDGVAETESFMRLLVEFDDEARFSATVEALAQQGQVLEPPATTSWNSLHAVVRDRYGVTWEIDCELGS